MQDLSEGLTDDQKLLLDKVFVEGAGRNLYKTLAELDAPEADKEAVAERLGGPGAWKAFRS